MLRAFSAGSINRRGAAQMSKLKCRPEPGDTVPIRNREEPGLRCRRPSLAQARRIKVKPPRSNPKGVVEQSPGLAPRQVWVVAHQCPSTATGLWPGGRKTNRQASPAAATPMGLRAPPPPLPRVVPSVQPWAWLHNRVAVEAKHYVCSWPLSLTRMSLAEMGAFFCAIGGSIAQAARAGAMRQSSAKKKIRRAAA